MEKKKGNKGNDKKKETKGDDKLKTCNFVKARHILSEKLTPIQEVETKLKEVYGNRPPASEFAKYAAEISECPSKKRGGELGYFGRGKMAGQFEEAAFSLAPGTMSDIVKTKFGYHLILVEDRKATLK